MPSTTVRLPVQSWSLSMEMVRRFWDETGFATSERSCIRLIRDTTATQQVRHLKPGLGKIVETTDKLYLKKEARPKFCRARQVRIREKIEHEIDRQVEERILESVKFSRLVTPVVPTLKKADLLFVRRLQDHRQPSLKPESYPLLRIEDFLTSLSGGTAFSKLDLAHAYQQVMLDEESREVITINTHKGLYKVNSSESHPHHHCSNE